MRIHHLLDELVIYQDPEAGECQSLGDIETGGMSLFGSGRESERLGMITPVRFGWNGYG